MMFPSIAIRKECFDAVGVFDEELPFCCDWDMWIRICTKYDIAYLKDMIACYRVHDESGSQKYEKTNLSGLDQYKMFNKIFRLITDKTILRKRKHYYFILAREQIAKSLHLTIKGNSKQARKYVITSVLIKDNPLFLLSFLFFYLLPFLGKYPSKLILKIGKMSIK